jgi:hypothetical protein
MSIGNGVLVPVRKKREVIWRKSLISRHVTSRVFLPRGEVPAYVFSYAMPTLQKVQAPRQVKILP